MRQKGEAEQKTSRQFDLTVISKACLTDIESKSQLRFTFFVFTQSAKEAMKEPLSMQTVKVQFRTKGSIAQSSSKLFSSVLNDECSQLSLLG